MVGLKCRWVWQPCPGEARDLGLWLPAVVFFVVVVLRLSFTVSRRVVVVEDVVVLGALDVADGARDVASRPPP